jgi:glutaryl-CoA transferase
MALFDTQLGVLANQASSFLMTGNTPRRMGNAHPSIVPYQVFHAADEPLVIACGNDGQFVRLNDALATDFHTDPRFASNQARLQNRAVLIAKLETIFARLSRTDILTRMEAAGVPAGPINSVAEAFADPQAEHRSMVIDLGGHKAVRTPISSDAYELATATPAPALDADGAAIRQALADGKGWPADAASE